MADRLDLPLEYSVRKYDRGKNLVYQQTHCPPYLLFCVTILRKKSLTYSN